MLQVFGDINHSPQLISSRTKRKEFFLGFSENSPILGVERDMGWLNRGSQRHSTILRLWNRIIRMRENRLPN